MTPHKSIIQDRGSVTFPVFLAERIYMREFHRAGGLPFDLARWQPTVDAMLEGIDTDGPIYLMIDQSIVRTGQSHRRPGLHVDGYWHARLRRHGPSPAPGHLGSWKGDGWSTCNFAMPEATILASNVSASRALVGHYNAAPREGGDCSHLETSGMTTMTLQADRVYAGNVTMLHESLPVHTTCLRTLVRLTVPGWEPIP